MRIHTANRRRARIDRRNRAIEAKIKRELQQAGLTVLARAMDQMAKKLVIAIVTNRRFVELLTKVAANAAATRAQLDELWANRVDEAEI